MGILKYADDVELLGAGKAYQFRLSANDARHLKSRRKMTAAEARAAVEQLNEIYGFK